MNHLFAMLVIVLGFFSAYPAFANERDDAIAEAKNYPAASIRLKGRGSLEPPHGSIRKIVVSNNSGQVLYLLGLSRGILLVRI